jgi:hypothetical protein
VRHGEPHGRTAFGGKAARSAGRPGGSAPTPAAVLALACGRAAARARWRAQRIRVTAVSGWSPNSCAIRPAQPRTPNRRRVRSIASATMPAVGASVGCSSETNRASYRACQLGQGRCQHVAVTALNVNAESLNVVALVTNTCMVCSFGKNNGTGPVLVFASSLRVSSREGRARIRQPHNQLAGLCVAPGRVGVAARRLAGLASGVSAA